MLSRRMARLLSSGAAEDRNLGSEAVYARIERVAVALPAAEDRNVDIQVSVWDHHGVAVALRGGRGSQAPHHCCGPGRRQGH